MEPLAPLTRTAPGAPLAPRPHHLHHLLAGPAGALPHHHELPLGPRAWGHLDIAGPDHLAPRLGHGGHVAPLLLLHSAPRLLDELLWGPLELDLLVLGVVTLLLLVGHSAVPGVNWVGTLYRRVRKNFKTQLEDSVSFASVPNLKGSSGEKHIIIVIKAHKICRLVAFLLFFYYHFTQDRLPSVLE